MKEVDEKQPLVSVWCATYNHAPYIKDALEGFLLQKTTFPFEVIIHDDASTDGTTEILRAYEKMYPQLIKVIYRKENTYRSPDRVKKIIALKKQYLRGKYVAVCEGDDYWTSPNKLQKQVEYMESHDDCMMTVHNAKILDFSKDEMRVMNPFLNTGVISAEQIIIQRNGIIPTASYLVRKEAYYLEGIFLGLGIGDWPMQLNAITRGYIYYFEDVMSVYRYMHAGSWSERTLSVGKANELHCLKMCVFLSKYNEYTENKYNKWIIARRNRFIGTLAAIYRELGTKEYFNVYKEFQRNADEEALKYVVNINRLVEHIVNLDFASKDMLDFCKGDKPLVVWGTGKYAEKYVNVLLKNDVQILGFLVSKKEEGENVFMGKSVWDIEDFPYEYQDVNILIALGFSAWSEVMLGLENIGVKNYYVPFLIES